MGALIPSAVGLTAGVAIGDEKYTTENATPLVIKTIPLPGQNSLTVSILVTATGDGTNAYGGFVIGKFRNPGLDTATLVGSADGDVLVGYAGNWSTGPVANRPRVRFAVSGDNCLVQLVGVAATPIKWSVTVLQAQTE